MVLAASLRRFIVGMWSSSGAASVCSYDVATLLVPKLGCCIIALLRWLAASLRRFVHRATPATVCGGLHGIVFLVLTFVTSCPTGHSSRPTRLGFLRQVQHKLQTVRLPASFAMACGRLSLGVGHIEARTWIPTRFNCGCSGLRPSMRSFPYRSPRISSIFNLMALHESTQRR